MPTQRFLIGAGGETNLGTLTKRNLRLDYARPIYSPQKSRELSSRSGLLFYCQLPIIEDERDRVPETFLGKYQENNI